MFSNIMNLLALSNGAGAVGTIKSILDGGMSLVLAVLLALALYTIYKLVVYIQFLQDKLQTKTQELLEKQISQLAPLTEALVETNNTIKDSKKAVEDCNKTIKNSNETTLSVKLFLEEFRRSSK